MWPVKFSVAHGFILCYDTAKAVIAMHVSTLFAGALIISGLYKIISALIQIGKYEPRH